MEIPIGRDYNFTIRVIEPDSFIPLDVTGYTAYMNVYTKANDTNVVSLTLYPVAGEELNGLMEGTINGVDTIGIPVDRASAADRFFIKSSYSGFISVTKSGEPDINVTIPDVTFIPTGV